MGVADSPNTRKFTCLTPPMSPASIAPFTSNQPRHRGSLVSGDNSKAPVRGGRQQ
jgi:hypothetical protein